MGLEANVLRFAIRISLWLFLNCRFMLMSVFNSTDQSIPCHGNNIRQARQCRRLVLLYLKLCWSAFSNVATSRNITDWNIMELLLESDSDTHSSEERKTFLLRVTVTLTMTQTMSLTQTSHSGMTIQAVCLLYL